MSNEEAEQSVSGLSGQICRLSHYLHEIRRLCPASRDMEEVYPAAEAAGDIQERAHK